MNKKISKQQILFIGKFSDVSLLLKEYQNKYTYLYELIEALNRERKSNYNIN